MDDIEKAVRITQQLRSVIMKIVGLEKEKENYDASDERIEDFFEEEMLDWNKADDAAAAWGKMSAKEKQAYFKNRDKLNKQSRKAHLKRAGKKRTNLKEQDAMAATAILAQVDTLLYDLMSYDGTGEAWIDADDVKSKEVLKLKEIIERDKKFHLQYLLLPTAA